MSFDAVHFPLTESAIWSLVSMIVRCSLFWMTDLLFYSEDSPPKFVNEMRSFPKQRKFEEQIKGMNFGTPIFSFQRVKDIRISVYSLSSIIAHSHMNKVFDGPKELR